MSFFNIKNFNSIQEAVTACGNSGGGTVIVPAGTWKSGSIHFMSNVCLHLEDNAIIIFSNKFEDYLPVVFTRWEGMECYNYSPMIYANGCENISITGKGTLIGSGEAWWHWKKLQKSSATELCYAEANVVSVKYRVYGTEKDALRPSFIQFINCTNILLEDFTVKDGPHWTIHPVYCSDVTVRNINVLTKGPNTDGLNPDSCQNVLIENCTFDTGDDCIAINAGMNEDGWRVGKPCKNIEIRNCIMNGGHGGVVIGSAISGGVENIYIHDCEINSSMQGIRLKSMRGRGGYVKNTVFENIKINDVTDQAIQITMFYEYSTVEPKSDTPSDFSNISIKNVSGTSKKTGIQIKGLPEHKLDSISLENIDISSANAFECDNVKKLEMKNINLKEL